METKLSYYLFYVVGGSIVSFLGGYDKLLQALLIFIILDVITGIIRSAVKKNLSSKISFEGLIKKVSLFILVGFANVVDMLILQDENYFRTLCITLILATEGMSIIENLAETGVPIPKKLIDLFEKMKEKGDDKNGQESN